MPKDIKVKKKVISVDSGNQQRIAGILAQRNQVDVLLNEVVAAIVSAKGHNTSEVGMWRVSNDIKTLTFEPGVGGPLAANQPPPLKLDPQKTGGKKGKKKRK